MFYVSDVLIGFRAGAGGNGGRQQSGREGNLKTHAVGNTTKMAILSVFLPQADTPWLSSSAFMRRQCEPRQNTPWQQSQVRN